MNRFWPKREDPEGFSIEKLAKKSKARLAKASKIDFLDEVKSISDITIPLGKDTFKAQLDGSKDVKYKIRSHWANRLYDEYREVA